MTTSMVIFLPFLDQLPPDRLVFNAAAKNSGAGAASGFSWIGDSDLE
jgi:hypothetical protein